MKLTQCLQFYIRYRRVPGLIRFGKHRVIPPISISLKRKVAELMLIEKSNLDILNKPYLSSAEENAFHNVVPRVPFKTDEQRKKEDIEDQLDRLNRHYTTNRMLSHLNKNKKWE